MTDLVGWCATLVFLSSYLVHPTRLLQLQILGAVLWIGYGFLLAAPPIIVANLLLVAAATWRARQSRTERPGPGPA